MKRLIALLFLPCILIISASSAAASDKSSDAMFQIGRLVIAGSIDNLEPVGIVDAFSSSTERVYCFLEAKEITADTTVSFVWYHGEQEVARVDLPLRQGKRWRTYSSKKLGGRTGEWKVELQDADRNVLDTVTFSVE